MNVSLADCQNGRYAVNGKYQIRRFDHKKNKEERSCI